ncbi:MAG: D-glycerate dehydrogenase [Candidatus Neomarinimicrobiota bacterium]|nr:MAG: D-glycerate dehydrogenase [Candidatus Neomarinimicrobiota bacterium]
MDKKIFLSRIIPDAGIDLLKNSEFEVEIHYKDKPLSPEKLRNQVKDVHGLICLLDDKIDTALIDSAPNLEVISNMAVGYNNIDTAYAKSKGIKVCNTPGILTQSTAELAWALLFAITRRIPESDMFMREGKFTGWMPMLMLGGDIKGQTLGVIGTGRIGTAFALMSKGFNMRILYNGKANSALDKELNAENVTMDTLIRESDFISLHVPLRPENHHLIAKREFDMMKPTAYLINTARGPVVDEKELVRVLKEKRIAGAALDVYENEPDLSPGLIDLDNVVLTPHTGSATVPVRNTLAIMAVENCLRILRGKEGENQVV